MPTQPLDLLFPAYRRQVLGLMLLHPDASLHVREIARLTGVPAGSLHRELRALADAGLLLREPSGNQVRYRANRACPVFEELAALLLKSASPGPHGLVTGTASPPETERPAGETFKVPRKSLKELAQRHHIRRLAVFGSAARGTLGPDSDIDLLVEFEPGQAPSLWDEQELQASLSRLFGGRRVDIAPSAILRNPYRKRQIEQDLKVLYDAA